MPTPLFAVSTLNKPELMLNAVVEEESARLTAPEVAVRFKAPAVSVKPFEAVSRPAEVIVPEPVVETVPEVVIASPAVAVDKVVPLLVQYPWVPALAPMMLPAQVKFPVA